jgi:hypothetical protein
VPTTRGDTSSPVTATSATADATTPEGHVVSRDWLAQAEEYLSRTGWQKLGVNERGLAVWQDPQGAQDPRGQKQPTVKLPIVGGGEEQIYQCVLPPATWTYTTDDAMQVQRGRDRAGQPAIVPETPIRDAGKEPGGQMVMLPVGWSMERYLEHERRRLKDLEARHLAAQVG